MDKRQEIIGAARTLFTAYGYKKISMNKIVETARQQKEKDFIIKSFC